MVRRVVIMIFGWLNIFNMLLGRLIRAALVCSL